MINSLNFKGTSKKSILFSLEEIQRIISLNLLKSFPGAAAPYPRPGVFRGALKNKFYPKKKGEFRMDITACPYCRYFRELGCPELTEIYCENDDRVYGNLPGLKFERTGTLGKGAERCDFRIRKN